MSVSSNITEALKRTAKSALRQTIGPAIGACVVGYFVYYAVQGDRGLIALKRIESEISRAEQVLGQVRDERERMERRASLLRADHLDRDMLDERARAMLNLTHPNDVILSLPPLYDQEEATPEKRPRSVN